MNYTPPMITSLSIIERLNEWKGWSYYRIAQELEVSQPTVLRWKNHGTSMSDETAVKAAEILGLDPAFMLANIHSERAQNEYEKKHLDRLIEFAKQAVGPEKSTLPTGKANGNKS